MKKKILDIIYRKFAEWSSEEEFCCDKGCSVCCTQNVTITAMEGVEILEFCLANYQESWIAQKLLQKDLASPPRQTTNEYFASYIEGIEVEESGTHTNATCLFLDNNICTIYPVRPFSCRCFVSKKQCQQYGSASVPDYYPSASLTVMQIIEHLGQNEYWGNMRDVLLSLCDRISCKKIAEHLENPALIIKARLRVLKAQPIPGFLFPDEDSSKIHPLIQSIFTERIGDKTIEQILNGQ